MWKLFDAYKVHQNGWIIWSKSEDNSTFNQTTVIDSNFYRRYNLRNISLNSGLVVINTMTALIFVPLLLKTTLTVS